jgi:non-homologous end joining protein Ku
MVAVACDRSSATRSPVNDRGQGKAGAAQHEEARGTKGGNVIDLMAVLKKSLQGGLPQRR